jgi:hypothetical protein
MRPKLTTTFSAILSGAGRSWCPLLHPRWSPEIVLSVVDGQALDARGRIGGALYENGSCARSDERTDVTAIIEARSDTELAESHSETVRAAVNIALVMARNSEPATVIW